ncbi:hypothetical protein [Roseinatronobacter sp.]
MRHFRPGTAKALHSRIGMVIQVAGIPDRAAAGARTTRGAAQDANGPDANTLAFLHGPA